MYSDDFAQVFLWGNLDFVLVSEKTREIQQEPSEFSSYHTLY